MIEEEVDFPKTDYPTISEFYKDVDSANKLSGPNINWQYVQENCPLLYGVKETVVSNFELYYKYREIAGYTEEEFRDMLQSCLNRNADTLETQLEFYDDDINKPIIGRTETVTYDINNSREQDIASVAKYGGGNSVIDSGEDLEHHVEVPANSPSFDTDRTRDRTEFGKVTTTQNNGKDIDLQAMDDTQSTTGTQETVISSLGVKPNIEYMNEFLRDNKTFIQFFIECFEECFVPRYKRVFF